ncbi:MAG TPA: Gfo/Idh/MocA family oxidoreductase [Bryobacteraceae bacterium]|nr:Gfo/Idh/MocA family oxidoreductase [Bryobacteraceae bacterium]
MERRKLLITGAAALSIGARRILGANDRVRVGLIGLGGRGNAHLSSLLTIKTVQMSAICDVNQAARERANARITKAGQDKATEFADMRKLFDSKDIDAVSMATPNHWHALGAIWAMQAGKDTYCEKPASYNPFESKQMIAAARKYNRMCQIGSQSRSTPHVMEAMQVLKEGAIGKVYMAKGLCYKRRKSIGRKPDAPVPPGLDWDMFLGPAPMRPFNELRFAYNWHWFWDTGNGDLGNQGVHQMDIARWGMDLANDHSGLKSVVSTGGKYAYDDMQETPNTQICSFDYGDREVVFEVRGVLTGGEGTLGTANKATSTVGNLFYGVDGWMELDGSGYRVYKGETNEVAKDVKAERGPDGTTRHMENFYEAVKSRDHKKLNAEIEIGAAAADFCHFANISYRTGKRLAWDSAKHSFDDAAANKLLTRDYRKPYVVSAKV